LLRGGGPPVVIGHRGAAAVAPENTMPSFEAGWAAGARWVEADVQPTADSTLVMLHDDDLDRTTDGSGPVRAQTASSLSRLDAGSWFGPEFAGTPIPRLAQVLEALMGDRRLLLEIKGAHTHPEIEAIIEAIRVAGAAERVFLESFEIEALRTVRTILPDLPLGLLVGRIEDDPVRACRELGATAYNPDFTEVLARPTLVADLHAAGVAVMVWTPNDPADWSRLTDIGVDAIITDDPGRLIDWQTTN
jgi:glycerophosphoryl diester phosphodiesterase